VDDKSYMRLALKEAAKALTHGDVPIGALLVRDGDVIAACPNEREVRQNPVAHAEILALQRAAEVLHTRRLEETTMYVTLEPCPMCAGALVLARVRRLVYGAPDPRTGAAYSLYNIPQDPRLNHFVDITAGVLADDGAELLRSFFEPKRA
jgi:tRNA(adenine34) deaminase